MDDIDDHTGLGRCKIGNEIEWLNANRSEVKDNFECPLCPEEKFKPYVVSNQQKLAYHFNRVHVKHKVEFKGYSVLPCHLPCPTVSEKRRGHYHCLCGKIVSRRNYFVEHIRFNKCVKKPKSEADEKERKSTTTAEKKIECPHCQNNFSKSNLNKHVKKCVSKTKNLPNAVIDPTSSIFLVTKGYGGAYHPIHVQASATGEKQSLQCSEEKCNDTAHAFSRGGIGAFACQHILSVLNAPSWPQPQRQINVQDIENVIKQNIIKRSSRAGILDIITKCGSEIPLAVWWNPSVAEKLCGYYYVSVFTGSENYYSNFQRVIVRFSAESGQFNCPCSKGGLKACLHKSIAKIHMCINRPDLITESEGKKDERSEKPDTDQNICEQTEYKNKYKKIPSNIQDYLNVNIEMIDMVKPKEETCVFCAVPLFQYKQPAKAKIYDSIRTKHGVTVYVKECPECSFQYRYNEYEDGLHMYNNTTIVTLQLCLLFRTGVQKHVAVGRMCSILEEAYKGVQFPQHILDAYIHFESLTDHTYDFNCIRCGHYPPIIILDANRKSSFSLQGESIKEPDTHIEDTSQMDKFWKQVTDNIVASPMCSKDISNPYKVDVQYHNWSQWMAPDSVFPSGVVNTEHRKVPLAKNPDDENPTVLTDEYIDTLLCEGSAKLVKGIAKEVGVDSSGSKMDIIVRLQHKAKKKSLFKKIFTKLWGRSGGILVMACPHGICYGIKHLIRAESVRDHIDMILSMKHQPTIVINDLSNISAAHGNNRKNNMFAPNNGRVLDSSIENLSLLEKKQLFRDMPCFDSFHKRYHFEPLTDHNFGTEFHPVTHSSEHLMLSDSFHLKNLGPGFDQLRDLSLIRQLKGKINTQIVEQMFSELNKDLYFVNQMTIPHHLFISRLHLHLMNVKKNESILKTMKKNIPQGVEEYIAADGRKMFAYPYVNKTGEAHIIDTEDSKPNTDMPSNVNFHWQVPEYRGILNSHQNCWLNSSFQAINRILRDPGNIAETNMPEISQFFKEMASMNREPIDPNEILVLLSSTGFTYNQQQDAHEFLTLIMFPQLHNLGLWEPAVIQNERDCSTCGDFQMDVPEEHFLISVSVGQNIQQSLDKYFRPFQHHQESNCTKCGSESIKIEQHRIKNFPMVLSIHLQRFNHLRLPGDGGLMLTKNETPVNVERTIYVEVYTDGIEYIATYRLASMICHQGTLQAGHYYTVNTSVIDNETFVCLNDSEILTTRSLRINDQLDTKRSCYILFYEKIGDTSIQMNDVVPETYGDDVDEVPKTHSEDFGSEIPENICDDAHTDSSRTVSMEFDDSDDDVDEIPKTHSEDVGSEIPEIINDDAQADSSKTPNVEFDVQDTQDLHEDKFVIYNVDTEMHVEISSSSSNASCVLSLKDESSSPLPDIFGDSDGHVFESKLNKPKYSTVKQEKLYCICQKPDDGRLYVKCIVCKKWFHPSCLGKPNSIAEIPYFACNDCVYNSRMTLGISCHEYIDMQPVKSIMESKLWHVTDHFLKNYDTPVIIFKNYVISLKDLKTVQPVWSLSDKILLKNILEDREGWLNDQIINGFIGICVESRKKLLRKEFVALDSFLWPRLIQSGRKMPKAINLSKVELVFIPIYEDHHWSLVIIQNSNKQEPFMKYYDPAGHPPRNLDKLIEYLSNCGIKLSAKTVAIEKGPYQLDGMACGVMVCQRSLYELFEEKFPEQTINDILNFRNVIICIILLQGETAKVEEDSGVSKVKKRKTAPIDLSKTYTEAEKSDSSNYDVKSVPSFPSASDSSDSDTDYPLTWIDFVTNKENLITYIKEICLNTEWDRPEVKRIRDLLFGKQTRKKIGFGQKVLHQKNYTSRLPNFLFKELVKTRKRKSKIFSRPIPFLNFKISPYLDQHFADFGEHSIYTFIFDIICKEAVIFILKFKQSLSYMEANNICISTEKSSKN